jgi:hypothetical protein
MNQEQFDSDNADESPAQLCTRNDWWHDFRGNPVRECFDNPRQSSHRSAKEAE